MATDFSISTLLDLPSQERKTDSKEKDEMQSPISKMDYFPVDQLQTNGKYEAGLFREASGHRESHKPMDLTRFPAADFTTIIIPKKHAKPRRKRTAFSNIQLHFLEQFFQKKAYPSSQERNFIASILNIGSGQVKTWYQNRRTKMKKNKVFGDIGLGNQVSRVSSALESNRHCIEFENQPSTSSLGSSHTRTAAFDLQCGHQPTWVGSNLLLLQQQSMVAQNR